MPTEEFRRELSTLINRHSVERGSDTPDFILADFLCGCIMGWNAAIRARDKWWDHTTFPRPSASDSVTPSS